MKSRVGSPPPPGRQRKGHELRQLLAEARAARARAESARRDLADILDRISDSFVALDREWRYTHVCAASTTFARAADLMNRAMRQALGIADDEDITRLALGDFRRPEAVEQLSKEILPTVMREGSWSGESTWVARDGRVIPISQVVTAHKSADGLVESVSAIAQDITQRKQAEDALRESEASYRTLIESASDGIFISDTQGRYVDVNAPGCRMLGYAREELLALSVQDVVVAEEAARVAPEQAALQPGEVVRSEWRFRRKDGTLFPGEVSGTILPDGRPLGILRDITERKEAQRASEESREQLRRLAGELLSAREEERAGMARESHDELGQLLTGIKMDAAWIARHVPDGESALRAKIAAMSELVDEAVRTVRQVAAELRPGVLDDLGLAAAIEWQADEFRKRSGLRCAVRAKLEPLELNPQVSIALFRICQESLTNVARHAGATSVRVTLEETGGHLVFEVSDDGTGISEDEIRNPRSIGLSGMRERAALAGGTCAISGEPGKGTTVRVLIPLGAARRTA